MDHIAKLTSEGRPLKKIIQTYIWLWFFNNIIPLFTLGYAQDAVIRALGITRNDVNMAWDILHEFGTKQSTWTADGIIYFIFLMYINQRAIIFVVQSFPAFTLFQWYNYHSKKVNLTKYLNKPTCK